MATTDRSAVRMIRNPDGVRAGDHLLVNDSFPHEWAEVAAVTNDHGRRWTVALVDGRVIERLSRHAQLAILRT